MHRFANPARFSRIADRVLPYAAACPALALAFGFYLALFESPADYQQGESVLIMYVHVPSAWMALFIYVAIAVASAVALIWRHPLADLAARASSPIGAGFAFLTLATGSLWGRPMWGTWWEWARSEDHTTELQSVMRISYAVFCLKTKTPTQSKQYIDHQNSKNYKKYKQ